ncbi:transposase, partial [Chitinophaga dinghuensis]
MSARKKHSFAFKVKAIRLVEKGQSIMSTSDDLDISPSLLLKWWDYY